MLIVYNVIITRSQSKSSKETLYWVDIRKLDRELCIRLPTLYTLD